MNTELFTVSRIFTESLYRIPDYQRGYSWRVDQLKDFWLDLEQLQGEGKHYMGVLTLEDVPDEKWSGWDEDRWIIKSRRYKPYYVVDGQQRITTVIILLQCILERSSESQLNFTPIQDIRRKYVYDSKPEESSRSYIFGYERDNPSYEFLKKRIFCEQSDQHAPDEETIYTKNLISAKIFFSELLQKMPTNQIELLFTKVTQQLVFNVYEISTDIDVFVTFETMNNRGKPLSTLELLKNRLIFLSTKIPSDNGNGPDLRRVVNDAWKTTYHYLGKNDARLLGDDEFLRTHLAFYYPTVIRRLPDTTDDSYEKSYRRYILTLEDFNRFLLNDLFTPKRLSLQVGKTEDYPALTRSFIFEYARNLKTAVETYFKLSTPAQSNFADGEKLQIERIGRLRGYAPSAFLVALYMKESDSKKRYALLEQFERLLFCQSLTTRVSHPYLRRTFLPDYYMNFISGGISTADLTTQFQNMVIDMFKEASISEVLHEWVKNGPSYYGWRSIKYFLYEYEIELKHRVKAQRDKLDWDIFGSENYNDDYETIEHIYPQTARNRYWTERFSQFNPAQKRLLRNSLGNLLPLAKPRNSSLGNKSFQEKLGDESTMTGYRYGSYAEVEVAQLTDWGPREIERRGIHLLEFLEKRWRISVGDDSQKLRALGLEFLKRL
ncbi:DUF262 domain-containing protein [Rhodoferax sp.]|uniref:DUF262 domain-containing protein n=1 Tax=Rhodoferax sp. TaxID=50421 RepID=UPI0027248583|nr:DUF262 domain-containing protein [Rhodoferax sp.]MDO8318700.1 DUF262 domain-containing protein [Rhodoferax sp.]